MSRPTIIYKPPKGTRDYSGVEQLNREHIVETCTSVFRLSNTICMDTPCFEQTNVLLSKSETSKLTFELVPGKEDGEQYTLRYDQTMSFARFAKQQNLKKMRRYAFGPVFRRDQPNMACARYRQFLQCDYDNLGKGQDIPSVDAETLAILLNILLKLDLCTTFTIKINMIDVLRDLFEWCSQGVPLEPEMLDKACRCLDKINKQGWKSVKKELFQLGITDKALDQLETIIVRDTLTSESNGPLMNIKDMAFLKRETKDYLNKLFSYLSTVLGEDILNKYFVIDLTLARGLDYYTGLLFEVEMNSDTIKSSKEIGSVAAGGRYDGLCGEGTQTVGFSLGIDRLLKFINKYPKADYDYTPKVWIIQTPIDPNSEKAIVRVRKLYKYRLWLMFQLRSNNIGCGTEMKMDVGIGSQIRQVLKKEIPYIIFVGETELINKTVKLKTIRTKEQNEITLNKVIELITQSNTDKNGFVKVSEIDT